MRQLTEEERLQLEEFKQRQKGEHFSEERSSNFEQTLNRSCDTIRV